MEENFNEDASFAQKNLFNLIIENLPDQIYLKDAESRFILCNTPVAHNAGFKLPKDVIGKTDFDLYPHEAEQFFIDEQSLMKLDSSLINHEEQFLDKETNELRWNLSTKVPIKDNTGKVVGLLGINRDITQMKKALLEREEIMANLVQRNKELEQLTARLSEQSEKLNKHAKDLENLNKTLLQVAWSNSHELRKPLCSILGLITLLKQTNSERERKELLKLMEICSIELDGVIKQSNKKITALEIPED
jgi:PAS domain S-box-containing protein